MGASGTNILKAGQWDNSSESGIVPPKVGRLECMCASHNLTLVINDAVSSIPRNEKFFTILQEVFNIFGSSLNRWRELQIEADQDSLTLMKKLCSTKWSSRIDTVRAVRDRYTHTLKVLTRISLTSEKTHERNIAVKLRKGWDHSSLLCLLFYGEEFWEHLILHRKSCSLQEGIYQVPVDY